MRQLETIWRKDVEEGREDDRERYSSLISRWNSSAFLLHTLEDLVTPEFTVPPTIRISRRGSKNPPLFPAPRFLLSPLQGSAMISRRRYIRARGRRGMHKISSLHGDQEEKTESRWPFTAGQPRYANSSRDR